jgi:hypothetical protein
LGSDYYFYNETPLKKICRNGITTISTDFEAMGKILANDSQRNKRPNEVL